MGGSHFTVDLDALRALAQTDYPRAGTENAAVRNARPPVPAAPDR